MERAKALKWLSSKVWVQNQTGADIIVYVQRSNAEKVLTVIEAGASAAPAGGDAHFRLEFALREHRVQKDVINAERKTKVKFTVGAGAKGAYVTVMLKDKPTQLFCCEREVPCGYCLVVSAGTFCDPAA